MQGFINFMISILLTMTASVGLIAGAMWLFDRPLDCDRLKGHYDAYRHCMQTASKHRCKMTPENFIEYYDIKHALEQCHGSQTDRQ